MMTPEKYSWTVYIPAWLTWLLVTVPPVVVALNAHRWFIGITGLGMVMIGAGTFCLLVLLSEWICRLLTMLIVRSRKAL
ncbi:MAG: hypothetical protein H7Y38_03085 [Armatimonadetes bacterium]|nr:hypothetical protein [Armatimonadota bacterium]